MSSTINPQPTPDAAGPNPAPPAPSDCACPPLFQTTGAIPMNHSDSFVPTPSDGQPPASVPAPNGAPVEAPAAVVQAATEVPSNDTGVAPTLSVTQTASTTLSKAAATNATSTAPADEPGDANQETSIDDSYDVADDGGSLSDDPNDSIDVLEDESSLELTQDDAIAAANSATSSQSATNFRLTDIGNGERLVAAHGQDIRYCSTNGKWYVWDGKHWAQDDTFEVERLAKSVIRGITQGATHFDEKVRKAVVAHGLKSESQRSREMMLRAAQSELGISVHLDNFDQDSMLFNVQNGTIDLRTGQYRPHDRKDLLNKISPVVYDPNAECPVWRAFLKRVTNDSAALERYLQQAAGYSLTGDIGEEIMFILYGTGANGKTKFLEALKCVLGDYAKTANFDTFTSSKNKGIRNDIARLKGARFVTASESDVGDRLDEASIKYMTGGDTINARFLYNEEFEFQPEFKAWLRTNHKPTVRGQDRGIWRRIKLVPFTVEIPPAERDLKLLSKLKLEAAGILNWMLEGLADYRANGLQEPAEVTDATKEYKIEQDAVGRFIEDCCSIGNGLQATTRTLYDTFKAWAKKTNEWPMTEQIFSQSLSERGYKKQHTRKGTTWQDIAIGRVTAPATTQVSTQTPPPPNTPTQAPTSAASVYGSTNGPPIPDSVDGDDRDTP